MAADPKIRALKNNERTGRRNVTRWAYQKGLHDLGNGCYAWLQPDGSWGYSNAGLIVDGNETLLVDTLFDLKLTREMLDGMRKAAISWCRARASWRRAARSRTWSTARPSSSIR
jgi:hypothetical protein